MKKEELDYINSVFEEFNKELSNEKNFYYKESKNGKCYNTTILRFSEFNGMYRVDLNEDINNILTPIPGVIVDSSSNIKRLIGRSVFSDQVMENAIEKRCLKDSISRLVENAKYDVLARHKNSLTNNLIGETFLKIVQKSDGNYFEDLGNECGYQIKFESLCAPMAPSVIFMDELTSEQKQEIKKLWDIKLSWNK